MINQEPRNETPAPQEWAGLWALWRGIKRFSSITMMALAGGMVGGFTLYIATIYCYGIGVMLGLPAGAALGGVMGIKMRPRDCALVFTNSIYAMCLMSFIGRRQHMDIMWLTLAVLAAGSVTVLIVSAVLSHIPLPIRYRLAIISTGILSAWTLAAFMGWLKV